MDRFFSTYTDFYNQVKRIVPQLFKVESEREKKKRKKKEKREREQKKEERDLDEPRVEREIREAEEEKIKQEKESQAINITLPESFEERLVFFVETWYPHMAAASTCDEVYFENTHVEVFKDLYIHVVMDSLVEKNRIIVWNFLHTLFALSVSLPYTKDHYTTLDLEQPDLEDQSKKYTPERKEHLKTIQETIQQFPTLVANIVSWKRKINEQTPAGPDDNQNQENQDNQDSPPIDAAFFENSQLGSLAREIASEIDPSEVLNMEELQDPSQMFSAILNQDENSGFGKLMKNVCTKLQTKMESGQVDQRRLFDESKHLLGGLNRGMPRGQGGPGGPPGMPDLSNLASMAQNLAAMGDLFGGAAPSGRSGARGGNRRPSARSMRRRMQRRAKKMEKQRAEQEAAAAVAESEASGAPRPEKSSKKKPKRKHRRKSKKSGK